MQAAERKKKCRDRSSGEMLSSPSANFLKGWWWWWLVMVVVLLVVVVKLLIAIKNTWDQTRCGVRQERPKKPGG